MQQKFWYFEEINKIGKLLIKFTKRYRESFWAGDLWNMQEVRHQVDWEVGVNFP